MEGEARTWWVLRGAEKYGPYTRTELREMAKSGNVVRSDQIWKEGLKDPVAADSLTGMEFPVAPAPAPAPASSQTQQPDPGIATSGYSGWQGSSTPYSSNPYQAPEAEVNHFRTVGAGGFSNSARVVSAGNGSAWLSEAWDIFKSGALMWILTLFVFWVMLFLLALIPLLGSLAQPILGPVFSAGLMSMAHHAREEGTVDINHFFDGFRERFGPLALVGLINVGLFFLFFFCVFIFAGISMGTGILKHLRHAQELGGMLSDPHVLMGLLITLSVLVIGAMLIASASWYAPCLVYFNDMKPTEAFSASFSACMRNWVPFLLYGLLGIGLLILGIIPFALGLLVVIPVFIISTYTSFSDLFAAD